MNQYEFEYKEQYAATGCMGKFMVTAKVKIARLIDNNWYYSLYWPKDVNQHWVDEVRKDLATEMTYAKDRIAELELAEKILNKLELNEEKHND